MKVIKIDGTKKEYEFENGERCAFGDTEKYNTLKASTGYIEVPQVEIPQVYTIPKRRLKKIKEGQ